jgi:polyisoprenoid-binding protein YceI
MNRLGLFVTLLASQAAWACPWAIDDKASRIGFTATMQGAAFEGRFTAFNAEIDFDPAHPESSRAKVTVPLASVDTAFAERDDELKKPDWFDIKTHPTAVFTATAFERVRDGFVSHGTLMLRGVTVPVDLPFTLTPEQQATRVRGKTELKRLAFGLGWPTTDMVGDPVAVTIDLLARPAPGCANR